MQSNHFKSVCVAILLVGDCQAATGVYFITPGPMPAPQSQSVSATPPVSSAVCSAVLTVLRLAHSVHCSQLQRTCLRSPQLMSSDLLQLSAPIPWLKTFPDSILVVLIHLSYKLFRGTILQTNLKIFSKYFRCIHLYFILVAEQVLFLLPLIEPNTQIATLHH